MTEPYLYILARNDLASLNPGKGIAQSSHATVQFMFDMFELGKKDTKTRQLFKAWSASTPDRFGTTITKAVTGQELDTAVTIARALGFHARLTPDPTYPLRDGAVTHLIPLVTCGYVFGDKTELYPLLKNFPLYP